mmetsp:Transcript_16822/g.34786  ORF Transcript_16822/g.34786 Transcript_16822/m.34786 type:complete len:92 (+) Transcript_16822:160-435(+)
MAEGCRVFVGNLSWSTSDQSLWQAFEQVGGPGSVVDAKVIMDKYTGRSRGFGFVTFQTPDQANHAMGSMNGQDVDGRPVRVDLASSRQPRD